MISGILFDYGGTLDSDGGHWLDRTYHVYSQIGFGHIDKKLIKEAFYWADEQADIEPSMRSAPYWAMMQRHFRWQFEKLRLKNPLKEEEAVTVFVRSAERVLRRNYKTLEQLHKSGLQLGVVSNFYGNVDTLCREFGYNKFLKTIVDSVIVGFKKPDPRMYSLALERLELPAERVLMVGDNFERDILPAKELGMSTAWLMGGYKRECPNPAKVNLTLRSLAELPERLKPLQALSA